MIIGQYSSHVGEGNRVTFPKKFSKEEGNSWLITKGLDNNLIMVASNQKELLLEGIERKPFRETKMRQRQTFVLGNTFEVVLDTLSRFVIPSSLFVYAGIKKEVIFAGVEQFVQVWDKGHWDEYQKKIQHAVIQDYENERGEE